MNLFLEHPALRLYALASAAIAILLVWLAFHTGSVRTKRRAVVNAEDVKVYRDARIVDIEHADVQRVKRAHANLLENAVPFLVLGLLYAMTEPSLWLAGALYLYASYAQIVGFGGADNLAADATPLNTLADGLGFHGA